MFELILAIDHFAFVIKTLYTIAQSLSSQAAPETCDPSNLKRMYNSLCKAQAAMTNVCNALYGVRNALDYLIYTAAIQEPKSEPEQISDSNEKIISTYFTGGLILIHTPFLGKLKNSFNGHPIDAWIADALRRTEPHPALFESVCVYILSVYPTTYHAGIPDPDNIDTKALGDPLLQFLGLDDNALNVTLVTCADQRDDIAPGSYVIVRPQCAPMLTKSRLSNLVLHYHKKLS